LKTLDTQNRTLSKKEAKLVLELEWQGKQIISLDEIQKALGVDEGYSRSLAHRLVQKGWFERLRSGIFQFIPAERGLEAVGDTNPFLEQNAFQQPIFYSFGNACSHYGFTDQVFAEMYVASATRHSPIVVRGKKYVFAFTPKQRFFGFENVNVLERQVPMALPERAILDALDRPQLAGGLSEVSRIIAKAGSKLDFDRLLKFARRWNQSALVQRLGYFLDLHQIVLPPEFREQLKELSKPNSKIYLAPRGRWKTEHRFNREWQVVENISRKLLLEESKTKRRLIPKSKTPPSGNRSGKESE